MILSPEDFLQKAKEVATEDLPFVLFKYPNVVGYFPYGLG